MDILDDLNRIASIDQGSSGISISSLSRQIEASAYDIISLTLPDNFRNAKKILFTGMGGSAYGARIIRSLYGTSLTVPADMVSDYSIPGWVDKETLVFAASYSGTTEETLSAAKEALKKTDLVMGISSGGPLADLMKSEGKPYYQFNPVHNPSNQPRLGQGYMQMGQIAMLSKLGYLSVSDLQIRDVVSFLDTKIARFSVEKKSSENPAKKLAKACENRIVILIGASFLEGAVHAIRNPFHETGKHMADYFILPEANHHLLEGLSYPSSNKENLLFFLIHSDRYPPQIEKRYQLTKEVIMKNGIPVEEIQLTAQTHLAQVFELIALGSFVTYYLGLLHGVDPAKIPWVDYFKKQLAQ